MHMGSNMSSQSMNCNYNCPICKVSGKTPNMAGRFFLISNTKCKCNACHTIFDKDLFYAKPSNPANMDGKWAIPKTFMSGRMD